MAGNQQLNERLARIAERYDVNIDFLLTYDIQPLANGVGQYNPATQTIYLNPNQDDLHLFKTFIHESQHAEQDLSQIFKLTTEYTFATGDFNAYLEARILFEAQAVAAEIMFVKDFTPGNYYGYLTLPEAESAWRTTLDSMRPNATPFEISVALSYAIYNKMLASDFAYKAIATAAAQIWKDHYKGDKGDVDHTTPHDIEPDDDIINEAESLHEQFQALGDYDLIYVYENPEGGYDVYGEKDGEQVWYVRMGGSGPWEESDEENNRGVATHNSEFDLGVEVQDASSDFETGFPAQPFSSGNDEAQSLIEAMATFSTPNPVFSVNPASSTWRAEVLLATNP